MPGEAMLPAGTRTQEIRRGSGARGGVMESERWPSGREILERQLGAVQAIVAHTDCPRCGGKLIISNERRMLTGTAILWLNCGTCGLFQQASPGAQRKEGGG